MEYTLIPLAEIDPLARKRAVLWCENAGKNWIGDKHKLASDIMNYAKEYHEQLTKTNNDKL